jgi:hypothetical protein
MHFLVNELELALSRPYHFSMINCNYVVSSWNSLSIIFVSALDFIWVWCIWVLFNKKVLCTFHFFDNVQITHLLIYLLDYFFFFLISDKVLLINKKLIGLFIYIYNRNSNLNSHTRIFWGSWGSNLHPHRGVGLFGEGDFHWPNTQVAKTYWTIFIFYFIYLFIYFYDQYSI